MYSHPQFPASVLKLLCFVWCKGTISWTFRTTPNINLSLSAQDLCLHQRTVFLWFGEIQVSFQKMASFKVFHSCPQHHSTVNWRRAILPSVPCWRCKAYPFPSHYLEAHCVRGLAWVKYTKLLRRSGGKVCST